MKNKCSKCGCVLRDKNSQNVGMCLTCFAIEMSDDEEPDDDETVEDGGGCYVAGAKDELTQLKQANSELIAALERLMKFTPDIPELEGGTTWDDEFAKAIQNAESLIKKLKV